MFLPIKTKYYVEDFTDNSNGIVGKNVIKSLT